VEEKIDLRAEDRDKGTRLDIFISSKLGITRSFANRLISDGHVLIDSVRPKPALKLKPSMVIHVHIPDVDLSVSIEPQDIPISIIYEDDYILVIDKPAGIVVHPGAGNSRNTLANAVLAHVPEIAGVGSLKRPGIVHRLDKMTSGVMVIAKTQEVYLSLSHSFKLHEHLRKYYAICYGHMPEDKGTIHTLLNRHPKDRKKMTSKATRGREAITHWEVVRTWNDFSLLDLRLETGRTHQIRVHLHDMERPIVGDMIYGSRKRSNSIKDSRLRTYIKSVGRQMLHAHTLGLTHPKYAKWMEFTSRMPDDMEALVDVLDNYSDFV